MRRARGKVANRRGCRAPTWRGAPRRTGHAGGVRRRGTHNAEILRAGAGAPRGLRRRDHNAEAERAHGERRPEYLRDYHWRPSRARLSLRHLEIFLLICLLHNVWIAGPYF